MKFVYLKVNENVNNSGVVALPRTSRYGILFDSVRIGPIVSKNRFFQLPPCNGMDDRDPPALAPGRAATARYAGMIPAILANQIGPLA